MVFLVLRASAHDKYGGGSLVHGHLPGWLFREPHGANCWAGAEGKARETPSGVRADALACTWLPAAEGVGFACLNCCEVLAGPRPGIGTGAGLTGGHLDPKDRMEGDRNTVRSGRPAGCLRGP